MSRGRDTKPHIGIFGRRNFGKSSFINTLVNQDIAIVSDQPGTTTDPVKKSIEIFGIGPAVMIDTAGIDDTGELGLKRIGKSVEVIRSIDLAILMIAQNTFGNFETELIDKFRKYDVPYIIVHNKSDIQALNPDTLSKLNGYAKENVIEFSSIDPVNLELVIDRMRKTIPETAYQNPSLLGDLVKKGDIVLLITPIDSEAPDGRMILPQVMAIRDVLDNDCVNIVVKEDGVEDFLRKTNIKPALAVTDSQVFDMVDGLLPEDIPLTSFSILFARMRGPFEEYIEGASKIEALQENDRVLILESCTHQVSCDDIGRFKIPGWIKKHTGRNIGFDVVASLNKLPRPITDYALVIQCGGCVITRKQLAGRLKPAIDAHIPVTNYGMAISYLHGIFDRAIAPFYNYD